MTLAEQLKRTCRKIERSPNDPWRFKPDAELETPVSPSVVIRDLSDMCETLNSKGFVLIAFRDAPGVYYRVKREHVPALCAKFGKAYVYERREDCPLLQPDYNCSEEV